MSGDPSITPDGFPAGASAIRVTKVAALGLTTGHLLDTASRAECVAQR
jgi:hypothetical protein